MRFNLLISICLIAISPLFAIAQADMKCSWTPLLEQALMSVAENVKLQEELKDCSALSRYFQSLRSREEIKKSPYAAHLLGAMQEKISALRVLWILDQYRNDFVNKSKTATFGQVLDLFEKSMVTYFEKLDIRDQKHVEALSSNSPQAVLEWTFMGQLYQAEVDLAASNWVSTGYKNETYQLAERAQSKIGSNP